MGWVQFLIGPGEKALVFTKTHGWEHELINSGTFAWRWQRLLPTNMTLVTFTHETRSLTEQVTLELPSSRVLADFFEIDPFELSFSVTLEYEITPEGYRALIPGAIAANQNNYLDVTEPLEELHNQVKNRLLGLIHNYAREYPVPSFQDLKNYILSRENAVQIVFGSIQNILVPDQELYTVAKEQFLLHMEETTALLTEISKEQMVSERIDRGRIALLQDYGKVLQTYPDLLQYFRLISETGLDPLNLQEDLSQLRRLGGL